MSQEYASLEDRLGHTFKNRELLREALTHTSYANEKKGRHNERLEFLGDSVLNTATTHLIYEAYPDYDEGDLSALRSNLVNTETLAEIGRILELGRHLRLGVGERNSGGANKSSILADATEALVGALYLDAGYEVSSQRVATWMQPILNRLNSKVSNQGTALRDPRSQFQERIQAVFHTVPEYVVLGQDGPPHQPVFHVEVRVDGQVWGSGKGRSKRDAIRQAAEEALASSNERLG